MPRRKEARRFTNRTMKVIQLNFHGSRDAHDINHMMVRRDEVDFVLGSEINVSATREWWKDGPERCGIGRMSARYAIHGHGSGPGFAYIDLGDMLMFSVYLSPNSDRVDYCYAVDELLGVAMRSQKMIVIGGDFNAKSTAWGNSYEDFRGRYLADAVSAAGLIVLNDGVPTFPRGDTVIDLTLTCERALRKMRMWRVMDEETLSDHRAIQFEIRQHGRSDTEGSRGRFNLSSLRRNVKALLDDIESPNAYQLTALLQRATELSTISTNKNKTVYWWSEEIAEQRRVCRVKMRRLQRARRRATRDPIMEEHLRDEYKDCCRNLRRCIRKAKAIKWEELCNEANENIWGTAYKVLTKKFGRRLPVLTIELTNEIVEELFPQHPWVQANVARGDKGTPFTIEELKDAGTRIGLKKSGGPDGTPPEAVAEALRADPGKVLTALNQALRDETFPASWKTARLVLLKKEGRPDGRSSSYRPLSLLNVLGKLYEQLLNARLRDELELGEHLSVRQYGFRKGKSTMNALEDVIGIVETAATGSRHTRKIPAVISLDIKNAFNSASWAGILQRLESLNISPYLRRIIAAYFEDRTLVMEAEGTIWERNLTAGVPQGSVLGPTLWNILYDPVLRLPMPEGVSAVAYADDLALVVVAASEDELMDKANQAIIVIKNWLTENGLRLAANKSEAVVMAGRRKLAPIHFRVGPDRIHPKPAIKYLGVWLDRRRSFMPHVAETTSKAERTATALSRMMGNLHGPRHRRRRLLTSVVDSIVLYAAPIWEKAILKRRARESLQKVQRRMALKTGCAYRTVGADSILAITGTPPLDLMVQDRTRRYRGMDGSLSVREMEEEWSRRWELNSTGWTAVLIRDLKRWVRRQHGETNHWLTQFLSGHGIFGSYLHRIGKLQTGLCRYCHEEDDTPEHTFFKCLRWEAARSDCWRVIGVQTPGSIIEKMCEDEEAWKATDKMVIDILRTKQEDERRDERYGRS
jgi:hypothetical protein